MTLCRRAAAHSKAARSQIRSSLDQRIVALVVLNTECISTSCCLLKSDKIQNKIGVSADDDDVLVICFNCIHITVLFKPIGESMTSTDQTRCALATTLPESHQNADDQLCELIAIEATSVSQVQSSGIKPSQEDEVDEATPRQCQVCL